jgi:hypothetical protein
VRPPARQRRHRRRVSPATETPRKEQTWDHSQAANTRAKRPGVRAEDLIGFGRNGRAGTPASDRRRGRTRADEAEGAQMRLSGASVYAVQALAHLAATGADRPVTSAAIARARGILAQFLRKILRRLVSARVLRRPKPFLGEHQAGTAEGHRVRRGRRRPGRPPPGVPGLGGRSRHGGHPGPWGGSGVPGRRPCRSSASGAGWRSPWGCAGARGAGPAGPNRRWDWVARPVRSCALAPGPAWTAASRSTRGGPGPGRG